MKDFIRAYLPEKREYHTILLVLLSALISLCLTSYLVFQQNRLNNEGMLQHYGESISQLAAQHIAIGGSELDAISLQAITRQITEQHAISSVIVYDINNNILSQVNNTQHPAFEEEMSYTTPLIAGNTMVGTLSLGITPSLLYAEANSTLISTLAILLLVSILLCYIKGMLSKNNSNNIRTSSAILKQPKNKIEEPEHTDAETTLPTRPASTVPATQGISLLINITNMDALYQQLNGPLRHQQLERLDQYISHTVSLYHGSILSTDEGYLLTFPLGAVKQALYCAHLIIQLNEQDPDSILILNAFIEEFSLGKYNRVETLQCIRKSLAHSEHKLFIETATVEEHGLHYEIDLLEVEKVGGVFQLDAFNDSCSTLLRNQLQQLQQLSLSQQ